MKIFSLKVPLEVKGHMFISIAAESEEEAIAKFWAGDSWERILDDPSLFKPDAVDPDLIEDPITVNIQ